MMLRFSSWVLFCCILSIGAVAQPTLPNISGSADKGIVLLSWNCQFSGIKAIAVLHSTDSVYNFKIIGYVKRLDKGVQAYVDGHPDTGKNYYKLSIAFNSGLTWTSNKCRVYIDVSKIGPSRLTLPGNEVLQKFIVTEQLYKPGQVVVPGFEPKADSALLPAEPKQLTGHKISLAFDADSTAVADMPIGSTPTPVKKKIIISFDEPDLESATFIRSVYIFTDTGSHHVRVNLPDDVRIHHYSVKFYDQQNHAVLELPKINTAKMLIDRRNFQRKGLFKFVLKRDGVEFETGYFRLL